MRAQSSYGARGARCQRGLFLIEAMIAILIIALGILGMIAMGGVAVSATSDANYRTEAQSNAEAIAAAISLRADRSSSAPALATSLATFQHQPSGVDCAQTFGGIPTADAEVFRLMQRFANLLPGEPGMVGATGIHQQVLVDTNPATGHNRVTITLCWRAPSDSAVRQHTYVTYVNGTSG